MAAVMNVTLQLENPALYRSRAFVDGEWIEADSGAALEVRNPADGSLLGTVPDMGAHECRRAIDAANAALPGWRALTAEARARHLRAWYELMIANQEDLARIMTAEQGKPLAEARGEVLYAASFIEWFAEEGKRIYGDIIPAQHADLRIMVRKEPVGVCAAITPWNFPLAMITRKAGPALAAGCTMVLKPAMQTPHSALALAALGMEAGIPSGVFSVVTGDAAAIGSELSGNPLVRKLSFTGSTAVGVKLAAQCAPTLKKLSLELGGNAPFIVFEDSDVDAAVAGAIVSKYRNAGQTCVCANRLLVQDKIYDEFASRLAVAVSGLRVGNGMDCGVTQGPLIDMKAVEKTEAHIADALSAGARLLLGGRRHALGGTFFEPTVLADVTPAMRIAREETFGPVAPLFRFSNEADAIRMANDTEFGLAAYMYSGGLNRVWRVAEALEYGIVGINTGVISTAVAPFGGMKSSGIGREGSKYGIDEYLEIKYVCMGGIH